MLSKPTIERGTGRTGPGTESVVGPWGAASHRRGLPRPTPFTPGAPEPTPPPGGIG